MTVIQFPQNPTEDMIFNVTPTKQMRFVNGRWKMHVNNIPDLTPFGFLTIPFESEEEPELPFTHQFWFKPSTGVMHYQYNDGESSFWVVIGNGLGGSGRETLTSDRTYYVSTTGSDTNNGLSQESPFLTIQKALDVASALDFSIYNVTIQLADGQYNENIIVKSWIGAGNLTLQGNPTNSDLTIINGGPGSSPIYLNGVSGVFLIKDIRIQSSAAGQNLINCSNGSHIHVLDGVCFGSSGGSHLVVHDHSSARIVGNYRIDGGAEKHFWATRNGVIHFVGGSTVTILNNPTFTHAFSLSSGCSQISFYSVSFIGNCIGVRYQVEFNSVIRVYNAGTSFLPGNSNGVIQSGGQYL